LNLFGSPISVEPQMFELLAVGLPLVFVTLCHESAFLGEMDFKRLDLSVVYDYYMCVGVKAL
jgi:hypothetical protein